VNPRKLTPETLAQADGVLAVFVDSRESHGDCDVWRVAVRLAMEMAGDLRVDDLIVHAARAQTIRVVVDGADACAVVTVQGHRVGKSLPRAMRKILAAVRAERRATERSDGARFVASEAPGLHLHDVRVVEVDR